MPRLTPALLKDKQQTDKIAQELQNRLTHTVTHGSRYEVTVGVDTRNNLHELILMRHEHGSITRTKIDTEFVSSGEYGAMRELGERLEKYFDGETTIQRGDKSEKGGGLGALLEWLLSEG